jgi:hypothetical protein
VSASIFFRLNYQREVAMKRIPTPDDVPKNLSAIYPDALQSADNQTHGCTPDISLAAGRAPQFMITPDIFSGADSRLPLPL